MCLLCDGLGTTRAGTGCRCLGRPKRPAALAVRAAAGPAPDPFDGRFGDPDGWRGAPAWHVAPAHLEARIAAEGFRAGNGESNGSRGDGRCLWGPGVYCAIGEDSAALYAGPGTVRLAVAVDLDRPLFYDLPPIAVQVRDDAQIAMEAISQLDALPPEVARHYDRLASQSWVRKDWLAANPWRAGHERWREIADTLRRERRPDTGRRQEECRADALRAYLTECGYDGLVVREAVPSREHGGGNQVVTFEPGAVRLLR